MRRPGGRKLLVSLLAPLLVVAAVTAPAKAQLPSSQYTADQARQLGIPEANKCESVCRTVRWALSMRRGRRQCELRAAAFVRACVRARATQWWHELCLLPLLLTALLLLLTTATHKTTHQKAADRLPDPRPAYSMELKCRWVCWCWAAAACGRILQDVPCCSACTLVFSHRHQPPKHTHTHIHTNKQPNTRTGKSARSASRPSR
jgi:hypothetical protein